MNRVIAVVEGQTEQAFVQNVLAPVIAQHSVILTARLVGRPGRKGGVGSYDRARRDILAVLHQDTTVFCTTMFDFYGMPSNWPQREAAMLLPFANKAASVENALLQDICQAMGDNFRPGRFIPYVQMHEFEALLFSEPKILAQTLQQPTFAFKLETIAAQFDSPELINDDVETAPAKRLKKLFPSYKKVLHGTIAAQRMGLPSMRQKCPHFAAWLAKLEGLAVK